VNMVALLLDNNVYGLTKNQTSPTSPQGTKSNTQPQGSWLPPMNPLTATLGVSNVSFLAQTAEWIPSHLFATLKAAFHHRGFSFVRIVQRCPAYLPKLYAEAVANPGAVELLVHPDGLEAKDLEGVYKNRVRHDPKDLDAARRFAEDDSVVRLGIFFRDENRPVYEDTRRLPKLTAEERLQELEKEFDRHAV
jgi:2-oxoglutarate/2-oxoacid ferredoxin oxidoreductase subunit beta